MGELRKSGSRPRAHDRVRGLGRRGAGAAGLDGMGGGPRRRAAGQGGRLRQLRLATRAASSRSAARTTLEPFMNAGRAATCATRRRRPACPGAGARAAAAGRPARRREGRARQRRDLRLARPRLRLRLHAVPPAPRHRVPQRRLRRARTAAGPTTRSSTPSTTTRASRTRRSRTASRWPRWPGARSCAWPRPRSCPSIRARWWTRSPATSTEVGKLADDLREETEEQNRRRPRGPLRAGRRPAPGARPAEAARGRAVRQLRAPAERGGPGAEGGRGVPGRRAQGARSIPRRRRRRATRPSSASSAP